MSESFIAFLAVTFTAALPLVGIGYCISVKNKRHWINGVDQSKLSDPEGFGRYVGNSIMVTGLLFFIIAALLGFEIIGLVAFALGLTVVSFLPLPCLFMAMKKYR
ncbi:hypothetical protein KJ365_16260 [Glaciecola sp. XM2]|jgi:hypothetical protein|uniref:hypothetical protein n=1 Tax=Glaciecola sp. XM2 TaxID=1914931 RepID=UPI001BDF10C1|nr:hypothetical protein [Glaciecola sp. XM2]MBT1452437.1 hypothetical protein [Glaciecola sp. XM2]